MGRKTYAMRLYPPLHYISGKKDSFSFLVFLFHKHRTKKTFIRLKCINYSVRRSKNSFHDISCHSWYLKVPQEFAWVNDSKSLLPCQQLQTLENVTGISATPGSKDVVKVQLLYCCLGICACLVPCLLEWLERLRILALCPFVSVSYPWLPVAPAPSIGSGADGGASGWGGGFSPFSFSFSCV